MSIKFGDIFSSVDDQRLENFLGKTKGVAEEMGKKSAERIELSRKKVELLDTKAKLSKLFEKYGKLHYDRFCGYEVSDSELEEIAIQIAELKNKIEIYTQDIEIAKEAFNESMSSMASNVAKKTREAFSVDKVEVDVDAEELFEEPAEDNTEE